MKNILILFSVVTMSFLQAYTPSFTKNNERVESKVYSWNLSEATQTKYGSIRPMLEGSTEHLSYLKIQGITVNTGRKFTFKKDKGTESMVIVKKGSALLVLNGEKKQLSEKSVAVVLPEETFSLINTNNDNLEFYLMQYQSKTAVNQNRGASEGGSFTVEWENVKFRETKKGGSRGFFERATSMCEYFEMHMTNLNEGIQSHPPHTHEEAEIMLLTEGQIEMYIDGATPPLEVGDLAFIDSQVSHTPQNTGKGQCQYYAFKWR